MSGLSWGRLYFEWAHDLKIQTLPEAYQRRHAMLLCMHIEGLLNPSDADAAFYMRLGLADWLETKAVFLERGLLDEANHLVNWERRQYRSDSSAARVRKYRNASSDRYGNVTVTPPETDTDTESETEVEEEKNSPPAPPAGGEAGAAGPEAAGEPARSSGAPGRELPAKPKARKRLGGNPGQDQPDKNSSYGLVAEAYHRLLPHLPPHQIWSDRDVRHFQRNRELDPARGRPEFWSESIFPQVAQSPFLSGRCQPARGSPWRASLPWLLNPDNVAKILNGHYPPEGRSGPAAGDLSNGSSSTSTTGGRAAAQKTRPPTPREFNHEIRPIGSKSHTEKR